MSALYREFDLTGPAIWRMFADFIKSHAGIGVERGKPLHIIVTTLDHDATDEQRAFYWSVVMRRIADDVWVDGHQYDAEVWHEKLAKEFLGMEEYIDKRSGEVKRRRRSIARGRITVEEMARYTTQVQAWAAHNFGLEWD